MPVEGDKQPSYFRKKVFIVHGHDKRARDAVAKFVKELGLVPIILQKEADKGRTVIEKFEQHANEVGYAIVLLTPDDQGGTKGNIRTLDDLEVRARQNVILELGFFYGKLGRKQVCALLKGNIEFPSDVKGVLTIDMDKAGKWKQQLRREMLVAGLADPTDEELLEGIDEEAMKTSMFAEMLSEELSKPKLSFKLISPSDDSFCDEIYLGNGNRGNYAFSFVLENHSPATQKLKGVKLAVDISWEGNEPTNITIGIEPTPKDNRWKIVNGTLNAKRPIKLCYEDLDQIVVYKHPERWEASNIHIMSPSMQAPMKGWFNIDYRVSSLEPYSQITGRLRLRFE